MPEMSENDILRAVFSHLRERPALGVFPFHPKNESSDMRGRRAGIHYAHGIEPGIPDVIIFKGMSNPDLGLITIVYALELKKLSRKGKRPTEHEVRQHNCRILGLKPVGVITGVAYGIDEAIAWLEHHGLLRGAAQLKVSGARP